ncbi:unnamed protein product [Cuscuta campestris]|uniref:3'-5' exonuclease domain-containing protein n=1 Tax=Cuscuta campestris TaxID=132261 RepID=A0A484NKL8_9ASTE|nr:unnamed protein product [Cuscuta campestris]
MSSKHNVRVAGKTIETTVTKRAAVVTDWVADIRSKHAGRSTVVVGLDREWRPNTKPNDDNKSATLQLCVDDRCLIFQLLHADAIPEALKRFMADPTFVFAGVEVAGDVAKLSAEYGLGCAKVADLRELARAKWPGKFDHAAGLKELAREICGLEVAKSDEVRRSDWAAAELSGAQVEYACIDAYASFRVGQALILGA